MFYAVFFTEIILIIAFLALRVTKGGLPAMFCKAAASVGFIGVALAAFSLNLENHKISMLMLMGFIFSLLGDIWLDLKYVYTNHRDIYLMSGFISFIIGHIFFIPAIASQYEQYSIKHFLISALICAVTAVAMLLLEKPMKLNFGKFRAIVIGYTFIVAMTMVTAVLGMIVNGFSKKFIILAVGGVAFALSDVVLSNIYFKEGGNTKANVLINHILYYSAQVALACSLLI